jgi:hypothetical protein
VPGNVADWMQNIRRNTDSSEAEDELRQKVESAAAASGITSSGVASAAASAKRESFAARSKPRIPSKPNME